MSEIKILFTIVMFYHHYIKQNLKVEQMFNSSNSFQELLKKTVLKHQGNGMNLLHTLEDVHEYTRSKQVNVTILTASRDYVSLYVSS